MPVNLSTILKSGTLQGPQGVQGATGSATPGGAANTIQYNNNGNLDGTDLLKVDTNQNLIQFSNTYVERISNVSISAGTLTVNVANGSVFNVLLDAAVTTFNITNTPTTTNSISSFILVVTADGTARTINWGSSVSWTAGTPPTITSTLNKRDVYTFFTPNAGTNWYAFISGQNI